MKAKYLSNWPQQKKIKKILFLVEKKAQGARHILVWLVSSHFVGKHMAFLAPSLVSASYSNSFALPPPPKKKCCFLPSHPNAEPLRPLLHLLVQHDRVGPGVGRHLLGRLALAAAAGAVLDLAEPGGKGERKRNMFTEFWKYVFLNKIFAPKKCFRRKSKISETIVRVSRRMEKEER